MLNLNSLMIGTMQFEEMSAFYEKVFEKKADMADKGFNGWMAGSCFLGILEHSEMNGMTKDPGRIMFNFETTEIQKEFDRLVSVGAKVIKEPYSMSGEGEPEIATLADPDGNYFQLTRPWEG